MVYTRSVVITKGIRTSIKLTLDEFKEKLYKELFKAMQKEKYGTKKYIEDCLDYDLARYIYYLVDIHKDCDVLFDIENISSLEEALKVSKGEGDLSDILGFHKENDFCWFGINAGGDWEWPIFFLIYYDGKSFRAYFPKAGNAFNIKTNEAFSNDEEIEDLEVSVNLLKEDFLNAIQIK